MGWFRLRLVEAVETLVDFLEGIIPISPGGEIIEADEKYLGKEAEEAF